MRVSNVTVRKRLIFILISGILIFTIIDIRLGYVQFFLGNMLTDRAKDSWSRNITFEPERGKILDRNGVELATNKSAPTVFVVPRQIEKPAETAEKLAAVLGVEKDEIYKRIKKKESIVRLDKRIKFERCLYRRGLYPVLSIWQLFITRIRVCR